jgi:TRAP-type uncharacterized transport system substrate-binding protein
MRKRLVAARASVVAASLLAATPAALGEDAPAAKAQAGVEVASATPERTPMPRSEPGYRERLNRWTLGLATGQGDVQLATELARLLDDDDKLRVVPMVTRGAFDNVFDLLNLQGVDAAIVYGDVLEYCKSKPEFASAFRRINYLLSLFPSEVHIFARPEIASVQDLAGKVVNFDVAGTAAAFTGPIVMQQLGIDVKATFMPHDVAMEKMRQGDEVAATFWVSSKPLAPFLKAKFPPGFKFLAVPYNDKLEYYTPARLESSDYPNLIDPGQRIDTIAAPTLLVVHARPPDAERSRRLKRLVDYLFDRFERLQTEPGYDPKWKDVNLAAAVSSLQRYAPLQEKLERQVHTTPTAQLKRASPAVEEPADEQDRLFAEFLEWKKRQGKP